MPGCKKGRPQARSAPYMIANPPDAPARRIRADACLRPGVPGRPWAYAAPLFGRLKALLIDKLPLAAFDLVDRNPAVGGVAVLVETGGAQHALVVLRRRDGRP